MANDLTKWPSVSDVWGFLQSAGITPRVEQASARVESMISAVPAEVFRATQRQFVADTVDETRYYDGTGTADMEIDEVISITSIYFVGYQADPGYAATDYEIVVEQGRPQTQVVRSTGSVPAFGPAAVYSPLQRIFPAGRQNIAVTGRFGYAATVPADLWDAVCAEMAFRLTQEALFTQSGRLSEYTEGQQKEKYELSSADFLRWHSEFLRMMKIYRRPAGRRLRNMAPKMI